MLGVACAPYAHRIPDFVLTTLEMLGQITIPLMLFTLGVRLSQGRITQIGTALRINGLYLVAGSMLARDHLAVAAYARVEALVILCGMLPPAVLNYLLTEHYKMDAAAVANVVLFGNVMSVVTIPVVVWFTLAWV